MQYHVPNDRTTSGKVSVGRFHVPKTYKLSRVHSSTDTMHNVSVKSASHECRWFWINALAA